MKNDIDGIKTFPFFYNMSNYGEGLVKGEGSPLVKRSQLYNRKDRRKTHDNHVRVHKCLLYIITKLPKVSK